MHGLLSLFAHVHSCNCQQLPLDKISHDGRQALYYCKC